VARPRSSASAAPPSTTPWTRRSVDAKDGTGRTALHRAAGLGDVERVRALLADGADPHVLDSSMGASPLHHSAQAGSVEAASLLLAAGAFLNLQAPTNGVTPLLISTRHRQEHP